MTEDHVSDGELADEVPEDMGQVSTYRETSYMGD